MHANAAIQTGATLFLGVLMTAALMIGGQVPLPSGTARVPSPRLTDSYDVLRMPLNPLLSGETAASSTPPGAASTAAEITMRPTIDTRDWQPSSNAGGGVLGERGAASRATSDAGRPTTRDDRRGTPSPRRNDPSRSGKPAEPVEPIRPDNGGSAQEKQSRGRRSTAAEASAKGRNDAPGARPRADTTLTAQRVGSPAPRRDSVKPSARRGGRPSALRNPDRADPATRRRPGT